MPYLSANASDAALNYIRANAARLDICSQEPETYAQVAAYSMAYKTGISIGLPAAGSPNGRQVVVAVITDGTVTATGTGLYYYAITDGVGELLAAGPLAASMSLTNGHALGVQAFPIRIPEPVSA